MIRYDPGGDYTGRQVCERIGNSVILVLKKAENKGPFSLERTHTYILLEPAGRRVLFFYIAFQLWL